MPTEASKTDPLVRGETTVDGLLTIVTMTSDDGREVELRLNPFALKRLALTLQMLLREVEKRRGPIEAGSPIGIDRSRKPS